jgi:hypothetical protein
MGRKTLIAGIAAGAGLIVAGWLVLQRAGNSAAPSAAEGGEKLARTYCQSCHLFPEPGLLDKASWTNGVLPDMAAWVGLKAPALERMPNGKIVPDSNVFPPTPLLSQQEWNNIVTYYAQAAPEQLRDSVPRPVYERETKQFRVKDLPYKRRVPMTLMVDIDAATRRLYIGDAMTHTLEALDSTGQRVFAVEFDSGPISILPRGESLDVALVGRLFPSDLLRGKVLRLHPAADGMKIDKVLGDLRRPAHITAADLNGDGREDFVVCEFGNRKGKVSWFEGQNSGTFVEHVLLDRAGGIRSETHDVNNDGRRDIFVLMGQAWEGLYLFTNEGNGRFAQRAILEQHPAFGYSYFETIDFDRDGDLDLLTANGDNGESAAPAKPYHGIRIYLNDGKNHFTERWFFPLHGAYGARAADFDLDGDMDVAAISYFPDFQNSPEEGFVYLENKGNFEFRPATIPQHADGRWMSIDAGDLDGDGDIDIVIGSLVLGPTSIPIPAKIEDRWKGGAPAVLVLENTAK